MVTESSNTLSGYGTYTKEVLGRLHATGKYEVAEFAGYAMLQDPRVRQIPWKVYVNDVEPNDPRKAQLNEQPINQFGAWRFDRVCLDFKPDIVFDIRDPWMLMFENQSPLRKYFHWVIMPTCDSSPQQEEWIDHFMQADRVFGYSDWSVDTLRKESGGLIKLERSAPPGVDPNIFKPVPNKFEHRRQLGFSSDLFIVGTIMRNQRRKLFPDLIDAFKLYLKKCVDGGKPELAQKSFLYFHTSYPDVQGCWNLPRLIKESGIGHKILCTYICRNCNTISVSLFQDAKTVCNRCNSVSCIMPSVANGLSQQDLASILNLFNVYVQYATCEGFGMPQVEAAACGLPVFSTDYSAMCDVVRKLNGYPIRVERFMRAVEEDAYKALPDNQDFADKLFKFASMSQSEQTAKGQEARAGVEEHYLWDKTCKIWESYFDKAELTGTQGKWDSPPQFLANNIDKNNIPEIQSNEDFVQWAIMNTIGHEYRNSLMAMDMSRSLNYEMVLGSRAPYSRDHVIDKLISMVNNHNIAEQARCGMIQLPDEDYLQFANRKRS